VIPAGTLRIDKGAVFTPGIDDGVLIEIAVPVYLIRTDNDENVLDTGRDNAAMGTGLITRERGPVGRTQSTPVDPVGGADPRDLHARLDVPHAGGDEGVLRERGSEHAPVGVDRAFGIAGDLAERHRHEPTKPRHRSASTPLSERV
jgi:hypothetical protein